MDQVISENYGVSQRILLDIFYYIVGDKELSN